ncbi:MAG: hypothetical protein P8J21_07745 [Alphaproteobacteria bacterium]|nr:hypothetical protein [Alphaproteobacteria bacterium]
MINKKKLKDYHFFLNPHAQILLEEYIKSQQNKMWATSIILSLTIIDNIISDKNTLEHVDGLNLNKLQNSKDLSWLRFRRNKILHYEGPIEGFYKSLDSLKVIKLDVDRADKVLQEFLSELFE